MAAGSMLKEVSDDSFESEVSQGVSLVDFFAQWCGPCHMQTPILEELAEELQGKAKILKLDIDNNQKVTAKLGVTSVPTMILFKDGQEVERVVGLRDADALRTLINSA
jgi:thioredoxin